ncbi:hypothetical protein BJP36_07730 [Moorena producens JHB]|uniref:Uncharacterized protein n=1 Tax=Moorena producens (strain JHB) TaxID=1454205 RepID=A0A1D9FWZ5_MOOP1|nr:hypothetical protein BJP36_07730 [Moorena producens JHB]
MSRSYDLGKWALLNQVMNRSRVGILPARKSLETGKIPVPPRCPFYKTLKIIPLFSNAGKCTQDNGLSTQNSALSLLKRLLIATTVLLAVVPTTTSCSLLERQPRSNSTLVYKGPVRQEVKAGSLIPGTDIRYISRTEDKTAEVLINGQRAFKRSGDSLDWTGSPLRGVEMRLNQRVLVYSDERLQAGGTVRLTVDGVSSQPGWVPQVPDQTNPSLVVYKVPVLYQVKQGETIPGTTLSYTGKTEKGAQLGGLPAGESPYRQGGDSISWRGELRPRVYLDLVVRTAFYNEDRLNVTGFATVILAIGG